MKSSSLHQLPISEGNFYPKNLEEIEQQVTNSPGHYFGLNPEALYTSKNDYLAVMHAFPELGTWVELGSGLGLGCALYAAQFPDRLAVGVEIDSARVAWAREHCQNPNLTFIQADLLSSDLPIGDTYFCYFPTGPALDRVLYQLGQLKRSFLLIAIESHGDFFSRLELESWLEVVKEVPLEAQRHHPMARIYRPKNSRRHMFSDFSFQELHVQIQEEHGQWVGETFEMEWVRGEEYLLKHPPRSIKSQNVTSVQKWCELSPTVAFLTALRRSGECDFVTNEHKVRGVIRKILLHPVFAVEISGGQQLKWEDIRIIRQEHHLCYESSSSHYSLPLAARESLTPAAIDSMPTMSMATTLPKK